MWNTAVLVPLYSLLQKHWMAALLRFSGELAVMMVQPVQWINGCFIRLIYKKNGWNHNTKFPLENVAASWNNLIVLDPSGFMLRDKETLTLLHRDKRT